LSAILGAVRLGGRLCMGNMLTVGIDGLLPVILDDHPVAKTNHPSGIGGDIFLVRDHDHGSTLSVKPDKHRHDIHTRGRIEVTCRLVGQD
jgi:hypothetical protein